MKGDTDEISKKILPPTKRKIVLSKYLYLSLFFLMIQQLIAASSTIWISYLGSELVTNSGGLSTSFWLFIGSLTIVYIPGVISLYNFDKSKSAAIYNYANLFANTHDCIPTLMLNKKFREDHEPWFTNESSQTIEETFGIAYDGLATSLNTILNIVALSFVIDPILLIGYSFGLLSIPLIKRCFKNALEKNASRAQIDRASMNQTLLGGWDNITVGNKYNYSRWWKRFVLRWRSYNNSSAYSTLLTQLSSVGAITLSALPILGTVTWVFYTNSSNPAKLAALVATLPRQIQVLQYIQVLSTYAMYWQGTYTKFNSLFNKLTVPEHIDSEFTKRIKWDEISFAINTKKMYFNSLADVIKQLDSMKNGLITIKGSNGSGKTTLLNLLKQHFRNAAFYYPISLHLDFDQTSINEYSQGQGIKAQLTELYKFISNEGKAIKILLLDEWDANLDNENTFLISQLLNQIAEKKSVIEIRHTKSVSTVSSAKSHLFDVNENFPVRRLSDNFE